jgi:hypothetical protein
MDATQRPAQEMRLSDDHFLAARIEKRQGRLDLRSHAADCEVVVVEIPSAFIGGDSVKVLLYLCTVM